MVGEYDELLQPIVVDSTFDYICFSNDIKADKIGVWKICPIPYHNADNIRLSRYVKLLPHIALPDYEYSLWIDANIQITGQEFYDILNGRIADGGLIWQVPHLFPPEDCVYDEIQHAYLCGRCKIIKTLQQYVALKKAGFPRHFGLFENNIIFRKHNDPFVIKMSDEWWEEFSKYTKRDQFNLMYVYWENDYYPDFLFADNQNTRNVDFLNWQHHSKDKVYHSLIWKIEFTIRMFIRKFFVSLFSVVDLFFK